MSAFKQKLARLGATAGVLVGATAALFAVGGASAGSAMAAGVCTGGTNITGEGSTLQKIAQNTWTTGPSPKGFNHNAEGCTGVGAATATYNPTGSGAGLAAWGVGSSTLKTPGDSFIGTDDAPNPTQLGELNTGLETTGHATDVAVIPVTQTAIAVVVNLPTGCTLEKVTNANLVEIYRGTLKNWRNVTNASPAGAGEACDSEITRIVRSDGSGTSYQLKHYLSTINKVGETEEKVCTTQYGEVTWAELQTQNEKSGSVPNKVWPNCSGTSTIEAAEGGGGVVKKVDSKNSSIGYAALPDAENSANKPNSEAAVVKLQDLVSGESISYASPTATGKVANCAAVPYNLPKKTNGEVVASWAKAGEESNLDWSAVYGSNKNVGGGKYSICTLTWDLAATNSTQVFSTARKITTRDYLKYVVAPEGGQKDVKESFYQALPNTVAAGKVQEAAEKAAMQIN